MNALGITKLGAACMAFALGVAFAAAPVSFDVTTGTLKSASAFAKHGADDGPGDDNGGGRGGRGGKGRGGHDDGPNHR
ncbi:hypothetical protein [Pararhizobium haloflavum]|uniref:hypothetical protein n=1 Tax=Pararhizobium haloflavum TaxID=2037914 RepID=UPI000C191ED8|nr:hypothetical protein [Pararhizobium haloflavum]